MVSTLHLNLTNLDEYITNNGSNLVVFTAYVQSQVDGLATSGEVTNFLIVNLFNGYKAVKDKSLLDYLRTTHEDRSASIDAPQLLLKMVNLYKNKFDTKRMGTIVNTRKRHTST